MNFLKNEDAIIQGGIFVLFTIIIAMITLMIFLPIITSLLPHLEAMDTSDGRFDSLRNRLDTSINLFEILPIFGVVIAVIFFVMRTIRKQAYGREHDEYER